MKQANTVGELLRRRLEETSKSPEELAEAAQVPPEYIDELLDGTRRPPLPGRTDVYDKMTRFLRLARNELATCASAERAAADERPSIPDAKIRRLLFSLCDPQTAKELERRARGKQGAAELADFVQRLLDVTHGAVQRMLNDPLVLRAAATQRGSSFTAVRLRVLEFLDKTPGMLTTGDVEEFIRPRVNHWGVDFETGVLRVVLRGQEPRERERRAPARPAPEPTTDVAE